MGAGLGLLRLDPRAFWAMTPKELGAALGAVFGHVPSTTGFHPARVDLDALLERYPDN